MWMQAPPLQSFAKEDNILCTVHNVIFLFSLDDVGMVDILVTFEEATYTASEGELIVEACVVTSATPDPGQTIAALVSTEDGTAIGMTISRKRGRIPK